MLVSSYSCVYTVYINRYLYVYVLNGYTNNNGYMNIYIYSKNIYNT